MEVSQLKFNDMKALMGSISTLTTKETIDEITIDFDFSSKKKIEIYHLIVKIQSIRLLQI